MRYIIILLMLISQFAQARPYCKNDNNALKERFVLFLEHIDMTKWKVLDGEIAYVHRAKNRKFKIEIFAHGLVMINSMFITLPEALERRVHNIYVNVACSKPSGEDKLIIQLLEAV